MSSKQQLEHLELAKTDTSVLVEADLQKPSRPASPHDCVPSSSTSPTSAEEASMPLAKAIALYPKVVGYYLCLTLVVVGWGFDLAVIGSITGVDAFKDDYGEIYGGATIIPARWLAMWLASTPMGMVLGSMSGGILQDRVGRRLSLTTGSIILAVSVAIIFFSFLPTQIEGMRAMFFVGKVLQGYAVGILKVTAMTFISETAPVALRGSSMALFPAGTLFGQLVGAIVVFVVNKADSKPAYLGAFGSQWILALAPFVLSCVMPESPAYLEAKSQSDKAAQAAHRLYAPRVDPLPILERMRLTIAEEKAINESVSYLSCFNMENRRRTFIVIMVNLFPALFGLELVSKSSYFVQTLGMESSTSLIFLIAGIVAGCVANGVGLYILSRVGRRPVSLISLSIAAILWGVMGVAGFWKGAAVYWIACGTMTTVIIACGMGVWPAAYAVMGEVSSLQMRSKTQAIGGVVQQGSSTVVSVILPYLFNPDAGNLGAKTGFLYVGTCILAIVLTWFVLPEMKGRTAMEIDQMFNQNIATRRFSSWQPDGRQSE
ncbi:hypothetical protein NQ176_g3833 [Zarea fungicola]|uniref:Uncharacterized protein n=1 Tax=Zarea fungicola TaxID=93591 RepID=A0ACC1NHM7_9HYPO|nr:hypothetical protein NQ176_g3833 [Lecanicillium fungicola]